MTDNRDVSAENDDDSSSVHSRRRRSLLPFDQHHLNFKESRCKPFISSKQLQLTAMAQDSPPVVLFTYPESVVGRRTEWYLTLRGIPYHVCEVDNKMPRPVLDRLGVHYRRIPVLAIGRDIYCDSRCIIDHLERLHDEVPKLGFNQKEKPFEYAIQQILENWAFDGGLFQRTAQMIPPDASLMQIKEWIADRSELLGTPFTTDMLKQVLPDALAHARLHLQMVEQNLLGDGREWLFPGDKPSVSDVHVLWIFDWMMRPKERMGMRHAYPELLNESNYPRIFAWVKRMDSAINRIREKNGEPTQLSEDDAVAVIEKASYWESEQLIVDSSDPSSLKRGDQVDLIALDSAPETGSKRRDVGRLEGLTVTSAAIAITTKNQVDLRIHYQRTNVRVTAAGDGPRLSASEVPT